MPAPDLTGERFGRLTVLGRAENAPTGKTRWDCRCDCGARPPPIRGESLRSGETRSCGCLHRERAARLGRDKVIDLTGGRFGRLTVVGRAAESAGKGEVRWVCRCDCGQACTALGTRLRRGKVLSCGCLRLELMRARAAAVGAAKRVKACRTCGRVYTATGPQKECSEACRRRWHAADEARRRGAGMLAGAAALAAELQRRLDGERDDGGSPPGGGGAPGAPG